MTAGTVRLGTASPGTRPTTAETLTQLEHITRRAASKKIDILLLPEAYIGGYPRGTHFGCVIGARSEEGRNEYLRYFQSAVDLGDTVGDGAGAGAAWVNRELPSDSVPGLDGGEDASNISNKRGDGTREELERIARETKVFIVTGLIEKTGGSMYCSVVYVCPRLGVIGKRRKVMPVSPLISRVPVIVACPADTLRPGPKDSSGPRARPPLSVLSAPSSAESASTSQPPSVGKTTCPWCGRPCTRRTSTSTSHQPPTAGIHGSPSCGRQLSKAAASS